MSLVEKLRTIAETNEWIFNYGRRDFHNLVETNSEDDPQWHFFLDPVKTDDSDPLILSHSGHYMILSKSDMDEVYDDQKEQDKEDGKWLKYISPKKEYNKNELRKAIQCPGDLEIVSSSVSEVINLFDENLDGIIVNFTIKEYL